MSRQPLITVVDYGVGNLSSLVSMLEYLGIEAEITASPRRIANANKLVLPGVGAFDKAISTLRERELVDPLAEAVLKRRRPILGICLGMQLFARSSQEGNQPGLGWIKADVKRIRVPSDSGLKVPNIGWMTVNPTGQSSLFKGVDNFERYYFVHSYHMDCDEPSDIAATVEYGSTLCCAISAGNVHGVQFHPEKSHRFGMRLLKTFALET